MLEKLDYTKKKKTNETAPHLLSCAISEQTDD